jgi:hypothetical protein
MPSRLLPFGLFPEQLGKLRGNRNLPDCALGLRCLLLTCPYGLSNVDAVKLQVLNAEPSNFTRSYASLSQKPVEASLLTEGNNSGNVRQREETGFFFFTSFGSFGFGNAAST